MSPRRPATLTASAVMSIVYGALFGLCGLCGLIQQAAGTAAAFGGNDPQNAKMQKDMEDALEKELPHAKTIQTVSTVLSLVEAIALLIGGIGLLGLNSWARAVVMAAAFVAVVSTLLQTGFIVFVTAPASKKAFKDMEAKLEHDAAAQAKAGKGQPANAGPPPAAVIKAVEVILTISFIVMPIVFVAFAIYLAAIIALLLSRSVRRAFAGGPNLDDRDLGRRDDDDDRGRRDDDRRDDDRFRDDRRGEPDDRFR